MKVVQKLNEDVWVSVELSYQYPSDSPNKSCIFNAEWSSDDGWKVEDYDFLDSLTDEQIDELYVQLNELPTPRIVLARVLH